MMPRAAARLEALVWLARGPAVAALRAAPSLARLRAVVARRRAVAARKARLGHRGPGDRTVIVSFTRHASASARVWRR